jgi:hypothetical protein
VILDEAKRKGFHIISRKGKPPAIEEEKPSRTALLRRLLDGGGDEELGALVYQYFSAVAHGTAYGLLQRVEKMDQRNPLSSLVTGRLYVTSYDINTVLSAVILGYGRAVSEYYQLMGCLDGGFRCCTRRSSNTSFGRRAACMSLPLRVEGDLCCHSPG